MTIYINDDNKTKLLNLLNEAKHCDSFIDFIEHYKDLKIESGKPNKT